MALAPAGPGMGGAESDAAGPGFAAESEVLVWQATRTAAVLAIVLVPAFGILDAVIFPDQLALFLRLRVAAMVGLGLILLFLHGPQGRRYGLAASIVLALMLGFMIDAMTWATGTEASPYYAGVSLVLLAVAVLLPWPPLWSAITALALVGGYVAPIAVRGHVEHGRMLASNLFFRAARR